MPSLPSIPSQAPSPPPPAPMQDQQQGYGTIIPADTTALLLGLAFCTICPLIAPAALLYFSTAYLVQKYQWVWVYGQPYQSGGLAWRRVNDQVKSRCSRFTGGR
jgi:hypothetical protein